MASTPRIDRLDKNYLINSAFDVWQRANAATNLSTSLAYVTADRFMFYYTGTMTGTPTSQRSTTIPSNGLSKYSHQFISRRNASTSSLSTHQRIEAANSRELAGQTVSVAVWVNCSTATTVRCRMATPTAEDNFTTMSADFSDTTATVIADSSWQKVVFENISVPTNANLGMMVQINLESASGTDGANTNHYITQISLIKGSKALVDFTRMGRNIGEESMFCRRYCWVDGAEDSAQGFPHSFSLSAQAYSSTACTGFVKFPIVMRATPTATFEAAGNYMAINAGNSSNPTLTGISLGGGSLGGEQAYIVGTVASGITAGNATSITRQNANSSAKIVWSAEL